MGSWMSLCLWHLNSDPRWARVVLLTGRGDGTFNAPVFVTPAPPSGGLPGACRYERRWILDLVAAVGGHARRQWLRHHLPWGMMTVLSPLLIRTDSRSVQSSRSL